MYITKIISNGSKWAGEEPDSIDKLLEVLSDNTIEERFFKKYPIIKEGNIESSLCAVKEWKNLCPIDDDFKNSVYKEYRDSIPESTYQFFGNFEEISHVFRIETNDPEIINKLVPAIKNNKGWQLYYEINKVS